MQAQRPRTSALSTFPAWAAHGLVPLPAQGLRDKTPQPRGRLALCHSCRTPSRGIRQFSKGGPSKPAHPLPWKETLLSLSWSENNSALCCRRTHSLYLPRLLHWHPWQDSRTDTRWAEMLWRIVSNGHIKELLFIFYQSCIIFTPLGVTMQVWPMLENAWFLLIVFFFLNYMSVNKEAYDRDAWHMDRSFNILKRLMPMSKSFENSPLLGDVVLFLYPLIILNFKCCN